ncbi:ABC transporter substrate-binding protein [Marinitoga sp. 1137]|uniref:ABC transporter substrate-binding protein n=1 Tax=Marinitoga sp. 1137 TaxID=1545835 RepID=UPI0009508195|nr:ABC transporter substrate-binding protein [Marinitoga sp. 1137]APT75935.1 ABC transporter substrate-binding protein [Marinitoga sp. 1137]
MKNWLKRMGIIAILLVFAVSMFGETFKREETFFFGGGLWSAPSNWNPLVPWAAVPGTIGGIYETLFNYDPISNELVPWLAEKGYWKNDNQYYVKLRENIKWTDGEALTADDVVFTFEITKKNKGIPYASIWNWLDKVEKLSDYEVLFTFSEPRYHEWDYQLYQIAIIPEHIWSKYPVDSLMSLANENPIGSGMYMAESHTDDRMIFVRNDNWWGKDVFGLPAPKRLVELKIFSNNVALGMLMKGELDVSNFFLPGIPSIKRIYGIKTWFKDAPYMLSDNTALLFLNTKKKPMDDPKFRKALAYSINVAPIIRRVFEYQVEPANPVGFLPVDSWMKYYDKDVVEKYGFKYSPAEAKKLLDEAGYKDIDGDGFREMPNGDKISLTIIVPFGWTDWMESIKLIAADFEKIGIKTEPKFPDYSKYAEDMYSDGFDILLNNFGSNVTSTPWTYFNWLFESQQIKNEKAYGGNWGRYENEKLFSLVAEFNKTKDLEKGKKIASEIEKIMLEEMPVIPVWYNGMWFQASEKYWTNYPDENQPYAWPSLWSGRWQIGGSMMILKLKPAK